MAQQQMKIPFFDVTRQYAPLREEVLRRFDQLLTRQTLVGGPAVDEFERQVAEWMGIPFAHVVASGTDALILALRAVDIGPGDEVITTPYSFFASSSAVLLVGARPVFVDIDPVTMNIRPDLIEKALTPKTKAILPVHLYGQTADMDPILDLARSRGLAVIEDFAQSIGAFYKGRPAGGMGDVGATSFYPTKNLGAAGEGGMVTTQNAETAKKLKLLRAHGMEPRYYHQLLGMNSRMDALQAAYLSVKLPHLKTWMERRAAIAQRYTGELMDFKKFGLIVPETGKDRTHVYHQYMIRLPNRDQVRQAMAEEGIPTEVYYPLTIPEQKVLRPYAPEKGWPESEKAARTNLALPIFPELTDEEVGWVVTALRKVVPKVCV